MRLVFKTLLMCWGMVALHSCFSYVNREGNETSGDGYADSLPDLRMMGITNPVVSIVDSVSGISRFHYETGRLKEGVCGHYGYFTVHSNPLVMEVRHSPDELEDSSICVAHYENICLDGFGRILSMDLTTRGFMSNSSFTQGSVCHVHYSMSYRDGYIRQISYSMTDEDGQNEQGKIVYTWHKGDITTIVLDFCSRYHAYEEHISQNFFYECDDSMPAVADVYDYDPVNPPYIHEFIWYTGMLGKSLKRLPDAVLVERCGDCGNKTVRLGLGEGHGVMTKSHTYRDGTILRYTYGVCP